VATVLVGHWTDSYDKDRLQRVLDGQDPFDEQTMLDSDSEAEKAVADR
jgi:aerobic C4-dicarboxylate transport protein